MLVGHHFRTSASQDLHEFNMFHSFPQLSYSAATTLVRSIARGHITKISNSLTDYPVAMWATHMLGGVISCDICHLLFHAYLLTIRYLQGCQP
jgi:hypothetical protein